MTITMRSLARISEQSPGYSVDVLEDGKTYTLTNIRFRRSASGRRNCAVVECDSNGKPAAFNSDEPMHVID